MRLSVIISACNEAATLAEIIRRVRAVPLAIPVGYEGIDRCVVELEREVVVVDDGGQSLPHSGDQRSLRYHPDRHGDLLQDVHPLSYTGREFSEGKKICWKDALTVLWTLPRCRVQRP